MLYTAETHVLYTYRWNALEKMLNKLPNFIQINPRIRYEFSPRVYSWKSQSSRISRGQGLSKVE